MEITEVKVESFCTVSIYDNNKLQETVSDTTSPTAGEGGFIWISSKRNNMWDAWDDDADDSWL